MSYRYSKDLKLWFPMEGNSNDKSGRGNNGTDSNMSYGASYGIIAQGATFNGSSSKITFTDNADWQPTAFTAGYWMKEGNTSWAFGNSNVDVNVNGWHIIQDSASKLFGLRIGNNVGAHRYLDTSSLGALANWATTTIPKLIIVKWSGTVITLNYQGKDIKSDSSSAYTIVYKSPSYPRIGCRRYGSTEDGFATGSHDGFFLYHRVLSEAECTRIYRGRHPI